MNSERVVWIEHGGGRVLSVDLRSASRGEQVEALDTYGAELEDASLASVNVLVLGDDSLDYHPDLSTRTKALMAAHEATIRRSAFLGFGGIARVAFDGFFQSARALGKDYKDRGRHFAAEERATALDWLVAED